MIERSMMTQDLITIFPTSSGVIEWEGMQMNKWSRVRKQSEQCKWVSSAKEWAVRVNERVAQYFCLHYWLFWTIVYQLSHPNNSIIDGTPKVYDAQLENLASKWINEYYDEPVPFRKSDMEEQNHDTMPSASSADKSDIRPTSSSRSICSDTHDYNTFICSFVLLQLKVAQIMFLFCFRP